MSRKRKILILLGLMPLLALCIGLAAVFYYARSPDALKALVERSISRATGKQCTISQFGYSLNPLFVRAKGIELIDHVQDFHLDIPELVTELSLQGPFTQRSLVVKRLTIQEPSLKTHRASSLTEMGEKLDTPGLFSRVAREITALLLFREIQIDNVELIGGRVTGEMGQLMLTMGGIHLSLNEAKSPEILCFAMLRWPSEEMELIMPQLRLRADRALSIVDPQIRMTLKGEEMTFATGRGKAENLSGETEIIYDRDRRVLAFNSARLGSEKLTLKQWNGSLSPPLTVHFETDGFLDFSVGKAEARHFQLVLKEMMEVTGAFHGEAGAFPEARVTDLVLQMSLPRMWPFLSEAFGLKASSYLFGGTADVTGNVRGILEKEAWRWDFDLHGRVKESDVSFTSPDSGGRGVMTADLQLRGRFPTFETELAFALDKAELAWKGAELKSAKTAFSASGTGFDFGVQNLNIHAREAEFTLGGKRIRVQDVKAHVQEGTIQFGSTKLNFPRIEIHTSLLRNLHLSLDAQGSEAGFRMGGENVRVFSLAQALDLVPPDWVMEGADSLLIKGALNRDGHWRVESKWTLDQFSFQSPDSVHAGEKISLALSMAAAGDRGQSKWRTSVEGVAGKGGFLHDRIYVDFNRNNLQLRAHGVYDLSTGTTDLSEFKVALHDLLSLEADGQLSDLTLTRPCHLRARLPKASLKPVFQLFFKEPFERQAPFLAELTVEGDFEAEMEFQKENEGWRLFGRCSWHGGEVAGKGFSMEGIDLDLPFWSEHPGALMEESTRGKRSTSKDFQKDGSLSIQSIALPFFLKQSVAARVQSLPNLLSFTLGDAIRTSAGEIELGQVSLSGLSTLSPSVVTSAALNKGDPAPLLSEIWKRPVEGSIRAKFDVLNFDGHNIKTEGDVKVQAFGGAIVLSNLGISGALGSTPALSLDATWNGLNLAELTQGTPFEKIEGILKGQVKHLEVVGGEPQRFDLFMETVQTKEVPQKIGVRALENIARIGGGGSPFMGLAGAFTSLFKEFPYDKIAIRASLENDVFRIDGPLKEGDKVYLVKRSGLSGVNVVNQDPDRQISFKDMMKRIKRVTESSGGLTVDEQNSKSQKQPLSE
ncbi:MAG: hypothetical protein ACM34H_06335 [Deltaproteobacteria bacterium]